jgi:hypothetical protein
VPRHDPTVRGAERAARRVELGDRLVEHVHLACRRQVEDREMQERRRE